MPEPGVLKVESDLLAAPTLGGGAPSIGNPANSAPSIGGSDTPAPTLGSDGGGQAGTVGTFNVPGGDAVESTIGMAAPSLDEGRTMPTLGGGDNSLPVFGRATPAPMVQTAQPVDDTAVANTESAAMPSFSTVGNSFVAEEATAPEVVENRAQSLFQRFEDNRAPFVPLADMNYIAVIVEASDAPQKDAGSILSTGIPLTVAIDPRNARSSEVAATFASSGLEVLALLSDNIATDFAKADDTNAVLNDALVRIPYAVGVVPPVDSVLGRDAKTIGALVDGLANEGLGLVFHDKFATNTIVGSSNRYQMPIALIDRSAKGSPDKLEVIELLDR
ncbi:MAG TPA: hypothetical protein VLA51_11285, partial [Paracoccaceae bacterium]|nr:hypothetical protein [Paracoccaceae bacterium]